MKPQSIPYWIKHEYWIKHPEEFKLPKEGIILSEWIREGWIKVNYMSGSYEIKSATPLEEGTDSELAKRCWIKRAENWEQAKEYDKAASCYDNAGELKKAKECREKIEIVK